MEEVPLIARSGTPGTFRPEWSSSSKRSVKFVVDMDDSDDDEDLELDNLEKRSKWRRRVVTLWPLQLFLLLLEHAQYTALLLSASQTWAWPLDFISGLKFLFWTNFDAWEYAKVADGVYNGAKDTVIASSAVSVDYTSVVIGWLSAIGGTLLVVVVVVAMVSWKWPSRSILVAARSKFVLLVLAQVLALPIGVALSRLAQCRSKPVYAADGTQQGTEQVLDVHNEIVCWSSKHWAYAAPSLFVVVLLFVALPIKLWLSIRDQLVSSVSARHEGYLRLKEAEFAQSLDDTWLIGQWHVFSSFKRSAVFYIVINYWMKLLAGVALGIPHDHRRTWKTAQASLCVAIFALMLLWSTLRWRGPFRVGALSLVQIFSMFVLLCSSLVGALLAADVQDPLLTGNYLLTGLVVINSVGLGWFVVVTIYLVWSWRRAKMGKGRPVWPSLLKYKMVTQGSKYRPQIDGRTARYLLAMLRARQTLSMSASCPAVLVPTHELSRHIQIINAYCREAEQEGDELHATLWDLLDDLMSRHTVGLAQSVFANSSKASLRYSARELYQLLPAWSRRLAQREHDFILMRPVKRRLLLKLYVLSTFMRSHVPKIASARSSTSARRRSTAHFGARQTKKSVAFADEEPIWGGSSTPSAFDLSRIQSQASSIGDEDDGVHERFLQQIDSWLPERTDRPNTGASSSSLSRISTPGTMAPTPDLFERSLEQQFPDPTGSPHPTENTEETTL